MINLFYYTGVDTTTPAALLGKTDTVALLVKSGANVNMKNNVSTVCYSAAMI